MSGLGLRARADALLALAVNTEEMMEAYGSNLSTGDDMALWEFSMVAQTMGDIFQSDDPIESLDRWIAKIEHFVERTREDYTDTGASS